MEQAEAAEESLSVKFVFALLVAIPGPGRAVKSACPMGEVLFTDPPQLGGKVAGALSHTSGAVCQNTTQNGSEYEDGFHGFGMLIPLATSGWLGDSGDWAVPGSVQERIY